MIRSLTSRRNGPGLPPRFLVSSRSHLAVRFAELWR
jgi:hypothetical protein